MYVYIYMYIYMYVYTPCLWGYKINVKLKNSVPISHSAPFAGLMRIMNRIFKSTDRERGEVVIRQSTQNTFVNHTSYMPGNTIYIYCDGA